MEKRIIFRISEKMFDQVNTALRDGKAKNASELVRSALTEFLKNVQTEN